MFGPSSVSRTKERPHTNKKVWYIMRFLPSKTAVEQLARDVPWNGKKKSNPNIVTKQRNSITIVLLLRKSWMHEYFRFHSIDNIGF